MASYHIYLRPPLPPFYRRLRFHKWPLGRERGSFSVYPIYFMTMSLFCISSYFFVPHSKLVWERKKLLNCMVAFFLFPFLWDFVSSQAESKRGRVRCPKTCIMEV